MNKRILFFFLISILFAGSISAQDTLPKFSVRNLGNNRIVVGWINTFETVKQISIQRSFDSLKNFKTILTVADPTLPENGYADTKATNDHMFYRLYIQLDGGVFLFSDSKKPILDTAVKRGNMVRPGGVGPFPVIPLDSAQAGPVINNRPKADNFIPSKFVFTFPEDGYVRVLLPAESDSKYSLKFFTSEDEPLFEIEEIVDRDFKIDKANFYRAGWFKFELYEDGKLKEKHRFYLPKEF